MGPWLSPSAVPTPSPNSVRFAPSMPHPVSPLHLEEETNELNEGAEQELTEKQRTEPSVCEAGTKPCRISPALLQPCAQVVHPGSPHLSSDHWLPSGPFTPCRPPHTLHHWLNTVAHHPQSDMQLKMGRKFDLSSRQD